MLDFEIITADEVETAHRGRPPAERAVQVSEILEGLEVGMFIRIGQLQANSDSEKITIGGHIRAGAKLAGRKVGIRWSKAGIPQVEIKELI